VPRSVGPAGRKPKYAATERQKMAMRRENEKLKKNGGRQANCQLCISMPA
jgi:hypothetical protein